MPSSISRQGLVSTGKKIISENAAIKVMQFGEGNFLCALVD